MDHELSNAVSNVFRRLLVKILCNFEVESKITIFSTFWTLPLYFKWKAILKKFPTILYLKCVTRDVNIHVSRSEIARLCLK